jgi:acetoin utilization protein AcuB
MPSQSVVAEIMVRDPITVTSRDSIRTAIDRMREKNCRRLPVVNVSDARKLVGIVSDRDLRRATNSPLILRERCYDDFILDNIPVFACMSANPITVMPQTLIADAAQIMRDKKIGGLPVVENGELIGIVTETDLLGLLIKLLEA